MLFRYIAGSNVYSAFKKGNALLKLGKTPVINYAIETSNNKHCVYKEYYKLSKLINNRFKVAIKLSSFDFDHDLTNDVINVFKSKNIKVLVDAESNALDSNYQSLINKLLTEHNKDNINIYKTYQMYRKDSLHTLKTDLDIYGDKLGIKLVRGAYWDSEKKGEHLYLNKNETDTNYNDGIYEIYNREMNSINTILATHNTKSINLGLLLNTYKPSFEFGHLMGMKENKYKNIDGKVNVYIPYGPYKEMIPYLFRRLYENKDTIKHLF